MHRILLVEDEDALREVYQMILATGPYEIDAASNGQEALEMCKKATYDLILLDLMMPIVDGVGFLEQYLRKYPLKQTKIIILSNLSSGNELDKALKLGAQKNIIKADLSPKQLLAAVKNELNSR